jgi:hypothetical protein
MRPFVNYENASKMSLTAPRGRAGVLLQNIQYFMIEIILYLGAIIFIMFFKITNNIPLTNAQNLGCVDLPQIVII